MKNLKHAVPALLSVMLIPASAQSLAQAATIDDCQAIQDRLARYACYDSWDAASGTVRQSLPRASSTPRQQDQEEDETSLFGRVFDRDSDEQPAQEPQVATGGSAESADSFGRPQSDARVVEGDQGSELIDNIAALEQLGPSLWLVTLEGGQQWRQMISKRYNLQVGEEIRIYSTRWGSSYRLSSPRVGGYIQVKRVDSNDSTPVAVSSPAPTPRQEPQEPVQQREQEEERSLLGRLFDRDADEAEVEESAPIAVESAEAPEASVEGFGRPASNARVVEGADGNSELVDTIAALEQRGPSLWLITLEGGQQWRQMISKRYLLNVGDEIRIYPTRWGSSYRLSAPRVGGYIQVERVD
jgi:hypothetical protein